MSQENLEIVRRLYEAWNGEDRSSSTLPFIAGDFEWVNPPYAVEGGVRRGVEGWLEAMAKMYAAFDEFEHRPGEYRDLGERILCFATFRAQMTGRGMAIEKAEPHLWTLRHGQVIRLQWFHDTAEALEAAGLGD